jgi:hypothetical protein
MNYTCGKRTSNLDRHSESDCDRVFERYYRCNNATGITGTGTGAGTQ